MIDEALFDAEEKMEKAVAVAKEDLGGIRTGRANPGMFTRIVIEYYGSPTPITQLASINVPEARMVVIKPYEAASSADRDRDPQLGPRGQPDATTATSSGSRCRSSPRNVAANGQAGEVQGRGRQGLDPQHPPQGDGGTTRIQKDGEAGEDEVGRAEKELDKTTAQVRRRRSTNWSSTKKPNCWRSRAVSDPGQSDRPAGRPHAAEENSAQGATCPPPSRSASASAIPHRHPLVPPLVWVGVVARGDGVATWEVCAALRDGGISIPLVPLLSAVRPRSGCLAVRRHRCARRVRRHRARVCMIWRLLRAG